MFLFHEQISSDLQRLFAATGRRCYLIGSLDGAFPDLGHHLRGEMGGLWTPPVKLADGFWFGLSPLGMQNGEQIAWMHGSTCTNFTMKPGVVEREYLLHWDGAAIVAGQQIFVPDNEPGLLIDLALHNVSQAG